MAAGVNLATLPTPMEKQAETVHALTGQHTNVHNTRWRQIQVPMQSDKNPGVQQATAQLMAAMDAEEADLVTAQRAAAQLSSLA